MNAARAQGDRRVVIAGFGNLLLGDDGFGVEVIKRLRMMALPRSVEIVEVGIGGMELVLKLMDGFDEAIVVDAVRRGNVPGTVYRFAPSAADLTLRAGERMDPHLAEPTSSMKMAMQLGLLPEKITVVGCEPESCALGLGLSDRVKTAVDDAAETIRRMVDRAPDACRTLG